MARKADSTAWIVFGGGAALLLYLYSQSQAQNGGGGPFASWFGPSGPLAPTGGTQPAQTAQGGGGGVLADVGKAVGAVGTVAGVVTKGQAVYSTLFKPDVATGATVTPVNTADTVQSVVSKTAQLLTSGLTPAADAIVASLVASGSLSVEGAAALAPVAAEMIASGMPAAQVSGALSALALDTPAYAGLAATGASLGVEAGSLYAGITAATLADISGAAGSTAASAASTATATTAGMGAAMIGGAAMAGVGLIALGVQIYESRREKATLEELSTLSKDIVAALTADGPLGAAQWLQESGAWPNTGRDWNYSFVGARMLDILAFPNARAENPRLTDPSMMPWEAAVYSRANVMATSPSGYAWASPSREWYIHILRQGRYPSRADYAAITAEWIDPTDKAGIDAENAKATITVDGQTFDIRGTPYEMNPFYNTALDTGR
jgi:hypothetical protein